MSNKLLQVIAGAFILVQAARPLAAQTLNLSSATAASSGAVSLNLSLSSAGNPLAALQWTFQYPQSAFTAVSATAGPALIAAGKSLSCVSGSGTYTCIAAGMNATAIGDGVIASINATALQSASISIGNTLGASPAGSGVPIAAMGGTVTVTPIPVAPPAVLTSLACSPTALVGPSSSACTVTLSGPAASATTVSLSSNSALIVLPQSVTILAGSSTAQFSAVCGSSGSATVTLTATLNGISQTAILTLTTITSVVRVDSGGGPYTDPSGNVWAADNSYSGGATWSTTASIAGTTAPGLYQTCRYGNFSYTFSVPNGSYAVTLKFAEISRYAAGMRVFNVAINGSPVLSNFDIFAQAGGANIALDKSFTVNASNGSITVQFSNGTADLPLVSAIDIEPGTGSGTGPATLPTSSVRVSAGGGPYTDSMGRIWAADNSYSGGETYSTIAFIYRTPDPVLYQTCRYGNFSYTFPVPNGTYSVTLKFAELSRYAAGLRVFNVAINGSQVLSNFDIFAQAGGANVALDQSFTVNVSGGSINIQFSRGAADLPQVNAIDIEPALSQPPVRVSAGGGPYTDPSGNVWAQDNSYSGGLTWSTSAPIARTTTPMLYQTCRYGNFSYTFSVLNGNYTVTLKFAEISRFAPGLRVFNVAINGTPVLTNFDIYAQAGGADVALDESFPVNVSGGSITIQFITGTADVPLVNAIDIEPGG